MNTNGHEIRILDPCFLPQRGTKDTEHADNRGQTTEDRIVGWRLAPPNSQSSIETCPELAEALSLAEGEVEWIVNVLGSKEQEEDASFSGDMRAMISNGWLYVVQGRVRLE